MKISRRGLTLMEMLLVTALVSIVGLSIFHAFSNGVKLWDRGLKIDRTGDVAIWMDRMAEDLRSVLPISTLDFKGTATRVSFPSLIMAPVDSNSSRAGEGLGEQIGAVEYRLQYDGGKIFRRQAVYGQALKGSWGQEQEVVSGVASIELKYYYAGAGGLTSKPEADGKIPWGISVETVIKNGNDERRLKRLLVIPVGG